MRRIGITRLRLPGAGVAVVDVVSVAAEEAVVSVACVPAVAVVPVVSVAAAIVEAVSVDAVAGAVLDAAVSVDDEETDDGGGRIVEDGVVAIGDDEAAGIVEGAEEAELAAAGVEAEDGEVEALWAEVAVDALCVDVDFEEERGVGVEEEAACEVVDEREVAADEEWPVDERCVEAVVDERVVVGEAERVVVEAERVEVEEERVLAGVVPVERVVVELLAWAGPVERVVPLAFVVPAERDVFSVERVVPVPCVVPVARGVPDVPPDRAVLVPFPAPPPTRRAAREAASPARNCRDSEVG